MCFLFCFFVFFFKPAFSCFFGDFGVAKVSLLLCSGDLTVKGLVPCFALFLLFNFLNTQLSFSVRWDQDGFKPIPPLYPDAAGNGQASSPLRTGSVCLPRLLVVFIFLIQTNCSSPQCLRRLERSHTNRMLQHSLPLQ